MLGPLPVTIAFRALARYRSHSLSDLLLSSYAPCVLLLLLPSNGNTLFSSLRALLVRHIQLVYRLLLIAIIYGAPLLLSSSSLAYWLELVVHIRLDISVLALLVLAFLLDEYCPPHNRYSYSERCLLQARAH